MNPIKEQLITLPLTPHAKGAIYPTDIEQKTKIKIKIFKA